MSWLRAAVSKAVEAGNNNNLTRTVKNYADSVVQQAGQAVAEGAKRLQDRMGGRSFRSAKKSIQRLEEAAVSCRGPERLEILRRWVLLLKEVERLKLSQGSVEEKENAPEQPVAADDTDEIRKRISLVLYYDSDVGGEPMNFHEVFLQSQALEGITLSMILEAPNDEEVALLMEMFRLCLTGGTEVHHATVSSIKDLATAFSSYDDEVLVKRDELLQFAQGAITGLKINADVVRIDEEASSLKRKLDVTKPPLKPSNEGHDKASEETKLETIKALKEALAQIRACSRIEALLLKKKLLNNGDSPEIHAQKVDKLKVLSESLASSSAKAENRILDHRLQKEEAIKVRVARASEVTEREKEITAEISELEKERDDLEAKLKKVNISLAAANARLRNTREEREQFEEANNKIVSHCETREVELSKSIATCKVEADILKTWINFLEDTWVLQRSYADKKEKLVNDELEKHEDYFLNLVIVHLSVYKKELGPSVSRIGTFVENLKKLSEGSKMAANAENEASKVLNPINNLEEEYMDLETKIITTFSVVDYTKEQFYGQRAEVSRKDDPRVKELFIDIEKLREQFEAIERPNLQLENPSPKAETSSSEKLQSGPSHLPTESTGAQEAGTDKQPGSGAVKAQQTHDTEAELAKLESEFGKVGQDYSGEEINDWEFDELERELQSGDTQAMAEDHLSCDHADDDYIDMDVGSYSAFLSHSMSSPPHPREFEFQMSSTSLERYSPSTSPADELFYKGKLLPLQLPPRLQMVEKLLQNSHSGFDHRKDMFEEFYSTPLATTAPTPTTTSTPFESCNISPSDSCQVSRELNPEEYILEYSTEGSGFMNENPKKSWTKKFRQSLLGSKLKASRAYFKSLFGKSSCSDESSAAAARNADGGMVFKSEDLSKYVKTSKKTPFGQIQREKYRMSASGARSFSKAKVIEDGPGLHRRSFSLAIQRNSTKISTSSSSSSGSSSSSNHSNGTQELQFLKRCNSASSEIESSIQGAIAHCKQSQQPFRSRKTVSEVGFYSLSSSRIAACEDQERPELCRG
ncbi:unnamed protein product [Malus baccata var. baccata]